MLVAEEFWLLTSDESGRGPFTHVPLALAGAMLCDLAAAERVALDEQDRIEVVDPTPTGDELLDEALGRLGDLAGRRPAGVLMRLGQGLTEQVGERLVRAELVTREPVRLLGMPMGQVCPPVSTDPRDRLRAELLPVLAGQRQPDSRTGSLIALLHATSTVGRAFPEEARAGMRLGDLRRSAQEIAEGRWGSKAVSDAIRVLTALTISVVT